MAESGTTFSYARLEFSKDQKQSRLFKLLPSLARLAIAKEKKQSRLLKLLPSLARLAIKEQKQIRLLKLLPSLDTDQISCTLEVVNWTPELQYATISYVWGDPSIKKAISINGQPFLITENLYTALWHIRKNGMLQQDGSEQPLPLWADAVCINQDNMEERSHQVPLMGSIYGSASRVICWLGRLEDDSLSGDVAITTIQEMAEAAFHYSSVVLDVQSLKNFLAAHEGLNTPNPYEALWLQDLPPVWQSIVRVLNSEFWKRVWIIQEIVLPVSQDLVRFTCGKSTTTLTRFLQFVWIIDIIANSSDNSFCLPESVHRSPSIAFTSGSKYVSMSYGFRIRDRRLRPDNLPLLASQYKASNPLDYVYGFRAILDYQPVVDYEKSKKEVYMDWFKDTMKHSVISNLIGHAGVDLLSPADQEWPSWLPDFASLYDIPNKVAANNMVEVEPDSQHPPGDIDGNVLHVFGVKSGDIVAKIFKPEPGAPLVISNFLHYVCFSILASASRHPLGVTPLQAFLITAVTCFESKTDSKVSFEHPFDTNDLALMGIIAQIIFHDSERDSKFSPDDYLSTYGPEWVSIGLRDENDLVDILQEQFLGTGRTLPFEEILQYIPAMQSPGHNPGGWLNVDLQLSATFQTTNGHIGIGPPGVKEGDEVCFFSERDKPGLLRLEKKNDKMVTKFVGVCYIHESSVSVMRDSVASGSAKYERLSLH